MESFKKGRAGDSTKTWISSSPSCIKCNRCQRELPISEFPKHRIRQNCYWCRECGAKYRKGRRQEAATKGLCDSCEKRPAVEDRTKCKGCLRKLVIASERRIARDPRKEKLRMKALQQKLKLEVFMGYGGPKCRCCGEDKMEFLSIDHVKGDGAAHRKKLTGNPRNGSNLYHWLKKNGFPKGFRVLCMNCNFAIGHFGKCPHDKVK